MGLPIKFSTWDVFVLADVHVQPYKNVCMSMKITINTYHHPFPPLEQRDILWLKTGNGHIFNKNSFENRR